MLAGCSSISAEPVDLHLIAQENSELVSGRAQSKQALLRTYGLKSNCAKDAQIFLGRSELDGWLPVVLGRHAASGSARRPKSCVTRIVALHGEDASETS